MNIEKAESQASSEFLADKKPYRVEEERKAEIKRTICDILRQDDSISFAYIYGSFTDINVPFHDIDLGVFLKGKNHLEMTKVAINLAVRLSKETTFPVDVRVLNAAPVTFVYNVIKGEIICENDEQIRCTVVENTLRHYFDIRPILDQAMKEAFCP